MKITLLQPPYPHKGTHQDAEACIEWILLELDKLKPGQQDLILLPEYANCPGLNTKNLQRTFIKSQGADFFKKVTSVAKALQCLIAIGICDEVGERWFNRTLVINKQGEEVFIYDKTHLTNAELDDLELCPGGQPSIYEIDDIRFGFAICFDLYFPEYFTKLNSLKPDIILCPSYQRSESADRIIAIAKIRALDSGAYLVRSSYSMNLEKVGGQSLITKPDGSLLISAEAMPNVIHQNINPKEKFMKAASHGKGEIEHQELILQERRPPIYIQDKALQIDRAYPHLCAHRGLSKACPENTLTAFTAAMNAGAQEIELDIWSSSDGELVVCHDEDLERTTNGHGKVPSLTWHEIQKLDAGIKFNPLWQGTKIPSLEQVFNLTKGEIGLNIHVKEKTSERKVITRICDLINKHGMHKTAYLALETETALQTAFEYAPEVERACLVEQGIPAKAIAIALKYQCKRIQFFRSVQKEDVQKAHKHGIICNLFYSDDPDEAQAYFEMGIDVLLTNCPNILADALPSFNLNIKESL